VAERHGDIPAFAAGCIEPGPEAFGCGIRTLLGRKLHPVVGAAKAQPGQHVDDGPQARDAAERIGPLQRAVGIHLVEEIAEIRSLHQLPHLVGQRQGLCGRPGRQDAGMHHQQALAVDAIVQGQWLGADPAQQGFPVRRIQNGIQRVLAMGCACAMRDRQQVHVMVAQHAAGGSAQLDHAAQHRQRVRAAIDEVAQQHQGLAAR